MLNPLKLKVTKMRDGSGNPVLWIHSCSAFLYS